MGLAAGPPTSPWTLLRHSSASTAVTGNGIKMEVATASSQQQCVYTTTTSNSSSSAVPTDKQNGIGPAAVPGVPKSSSVQPAAPNHPTKISSAAASATAAAATPSGHATKHNTHTPSSSSSHGNTTQNSSSQRLSRHSSTNSPATPNRHVNFGGGGDSAEEKKREKFLTAKYGAHQMALIRKRLRVEMWMYERLQELYGADDIEIDLDEVLDMEDESDRRSYISELLRIDGNHPCTKAERVNVFVGDLLEKVKTL